MNRTLCHLLLDWSLILDHSAKSQPDKVVFFMFNVSFKNDLFQQYMFMVSTLFCGKVFFFSICTKVVHTHTHPPSSSTVLLPHSTLTSNLSNTFGMKWNKDCEPDLITKHLRWTTLMLLWINESKSLQPDIKKISIKSLINRSVDVSTYFCLYLSSLEVSPHNNLYLSSSINFSLGFSSSSSVLVYHQQVMRHGASWLQMPQPCA